MEFIFRRVTGSSVCTKAVPIECPSKKDSVRKLQDKQTCDLILYETSLATSPFMWATNEVENRTLIEQNILFENSHLASELIRNTSNSIESLSIK